MTTIEVADGRLHIAYGEHSPCALVEVRPVFFATPTALREAAAALLRCADDIETRRLLRRKP